MIYLMMKEIKMNIKIDNQDIVIYKGVNIYSIDKM
jgi:hypothetical protein